MKKHLLLVLAIFVLTNYTFSQEEGASSIIVDGKVNIDSIYQKKDELIIVSGIHSFDSISKLDLIKKVKHWGGKKFVNLKEVLVSETEDQLVFTYITNSYYIKTVMGKQPLPWYIRLIIQFKDGRIRCTFYDDGNVTMLADQYSPGAAARTIKLKDYFKESDGVFVNRAKSLTNGLVALRNSIEKDFLSIKEDILKGDSKSEDW
jgi:hypothetical protein